MEINVRKKAENIVALLNNKEKISEIRDKATINRNKLVSIQVSFLWCVVAFNRLCCLELGTLASHQQEYHISLVQLRLVVVFKVVQAIMIGTPEEKTKTITSLFKSQGAVLKVKSKATLRRKAFQGMTGFASAPIDMLLLLTY